MKQIVECILNVSEGRNRHVIEAIGTSLESVKQARLLDVSSDVTHHRTVFTFAATASAIGAAAYAGIASACRLIDMRTHRGVHPRIGAADVVPFVPIRQVRMDECIGIAHSLGRQVGEQLQVPVYYYGEAAIVPHHRNLADLRRGQFEGLAERLATPMWAPDAGPPQPHPSAGAIAIGARSRLIAFNIYLGTRDLGIGRTIASQIRARDGGMAGVKALGLFIDHRDQVQVSMNLTDPDTTSMQSVFERVERAAQSLGVEVDCSELIGLVSKQDLTEAEARHMRILDFDQRKFLEERLEGN